MAKISLEVMVMGKIVAICNPKGGTAKTSTAVNLACALKTVNKKVLLVDFDPQRSASVALGYEYTDIEHNIGTVVLDNVDIEQCITPYLKGGFDVILSSDDLVALPSALQGKLNSYNALEKALDKVKNKYDYIIIDTPASLNMLLVCAICAADYMIVPVCCDLFALDSMKMLIDKYKDLKEKGLTNTILLGIIRTMYDKLQPLAKTISDELEKSFDELLFKSSITYNPKISESSSAALPVLLYDRTSLGAQEYLSFAGEFLKKLR